VNEVTLTSFQSLLDANGDGIVRSIPVQLNGARASFTPNSMPSTSGVAGVECEFANEQILTSSSVPWFTSIEDITTYPSYIANLSEMGAGLYGGSYLEGAPVTYGTGHYWEEGVIHAYAGEGRHYLGCDGGSGANRGVSYIEFAAGASTGTFVHEYGDPPGSATEYTITFNSVPIAPTYAAPSFPNPLYYRFVRNAKQVFYNGSSQTLVFMHLHVEQNGQTYNQQFDYLAPTGLGTGGTGPFQLGYPTTDTSVAKPGTRFLWWRAQGSDTQPPDQDFGFSSWWTAPEVYSATAQSFASHGGTVSGWFDSGDTGAYWKTLTLPNILTRGGTTVGTGSSVGLRFAATNSLPIGSSTALMSGGPQTVYAGVSPQYDLGNAQGRYLAIELTFTPGTAWPMNAANAYLQGQPGVLPEAVAIWETVASPPAPPGPPLVELTFASEGTAVASLPYTPEFAIEDSVTWRKNVFEAEAPYTRRRLIGTATRDRWRLRWTLTAAEYDVMHQFFEDRRGGAQSIAWLAPNEKIIRTVSLLDDSITYTKLAPDAYRLEATVEEVLP